MKKKLLLILSLSLFLAACGKNASKDTAKELESKQETQIESVKETETDTNKETKEETKAENNTSSKVTGKSHNGTAKISYKAAEIKEMMTSSYKGDKKIAFLTFDDGPNTSITPQVLDTLKEKNVKATFFVVGKFINETSGKVLKRIYDEGHAVATHSYTHDYQTLYPGRKADADTLVSEQKKSMEKIRTYLGKDFNTGAFRYPGGHMSWNQDSLKKADKALRDAGAEWIDWNTMNGDAQPKKVGANDIARPTNVNEVIKNFDKSRTYIPHDKVIVVLMHDAQGKDLTAKALPDLIDHIKSEGYEFGVIE